MRWYYLSHFTRYKLALDKIPLHTVDKHDALGADQNNQKGGCCTTSMMQVAGLTMISWSQDFATEPRRSDDRPTH